MKLNLIQKIRLAFRRAFERKNMAKIVYQKKSDGNLGTYFIDMNFIDFVKNKYKLKRRSGSRRQAMGKCDGRTCTHARNNFHCFCLNFKIKTLSQKTFVEMAPDGLEAPVRSHAGIAAARRHLSFSAHKLCFT